MQGGEAFKIGIEQEQTAVVQLPARLLLIIFRNLFPKSWYFLGTAFLVCAIVGRRVWRELPYRNWFRKGEQSCFVAFFQGYISYNQSGIDGT